MAIKKIESINVIPFIDIMLVLLAIVLTTATFIAKGSIKIDLPQASAKSAKIEKPREITITADAKIYLDGVESANDKLGLALTATPKETTIIVSGDANMDYKYFVSVVDILIASGYTHISIATKQK